VQRHVQDVAGHDAADAHALGVFIRDLAGDGELRVHRRFASGERDGDAGRMCTYGLDGEPERRTDAITLVWLRQRIRNGDRRGE
jgi:hypothetical protein